MMQNYLVFIKDTQLISLKKWSDAITGHGFDLRFSHRFNLHKQNGVIRCIFNKEASGFEYGFEKFGNLHDMFDEEDFNAREKRKLAGMNAVISFICGSKRCDHLAMVVASSVFTEQTDGLLVAYDEWIKADKAVNNARQFLKHELKAYSRAKKNPVDETLKKSFYEFRDQLHRNKKKAFNFFRAALKNLKGRPVIECGDVGTISLNFASDTYLRADEWTVRKNKKVIFDSNKHLPDPESEGAETFAIAICKHGKFLFKQIRGSKINRTMLTPSGHIVLYFKNGVDITCRMTKNKDWQGNTWDFTYRNLQFSLLSKKYLDIQGVYSEPDKHCLSDPIGLS